MNRPPSIDELLEGRVVQGQFAELHPVGLDDASFILSLRTGRQRDNFLRDTSSDVSAQRAYLESYLQRFRHGEEIYYKVLDRRRGKMAGVVRLTELKGGDVFNWQSLVVAEDASPQLALDIMFLIYAIGFEWLGRVKCGPWDVKKSFDKMMKIHSSIGMAEVVGSDEDYWHVAVLREKFLARIGKYRKMGLGVLSA